MRQIFSILILILILTSRGFASPVNDNAGLLSQDEIYSLEQKIRSIESKHGIRIGIQTTTSIPGDIETTANRILDQQYAGGMNGSILLLIDMGSRNWRISTDSTMRDRISSEDGVNFLSQRFVSSLSGGNYFSAFSSFIDGVDTLMSYYKENDSAYTEDEGIFNPMAAGFSGIFSLIFGGMYKSSLKASMSNVNPARGASSYLIQNSLKLTENRDSFLFRNIRRQPKSQGSSSHSSGNSGSHGGGGGSF